MKKKELWQEVWERPAVEPDVEQPVDDKFAVEPPAADCCIAFVRKRMAIVVYGTR